MYILSFNLKEQLMLLLQNVNEVKQSTPTLAASFTICDSTRQNGLVTIVFNTTVTIKIPNARIPDSYKPPRMSSLFNGGC